MGMMLDTLKLAERLQAGGFTPEQSKTAAAAFADSIGEWFAAQQLATKIDLAEVEAALKSDLAKVEVALKSDLAKVEVALKSDLTALKTNLEAKLETKLAEVKVDLIKWVVGISFAQATMILAVIKLM